MSAYSVQQAHDSLLASVPAGIRHEPCVLCHPGAGTAMAKEEAEVAEGVRTFSEAEHLALLTDAVARETASLATVKEELEGQIATLQTEKAAELAAKSELQSRIDVLEADKVAAETARDTVTAEFDAFKSDLAQKAEIEARKADRVARIKAANATLADTYFTNERAQRWAEMPDESFNALVADLTEVAGGQPASTAVTAEAARETAAFRGGQSATSAGSTLGSFFTATGHLPAMAN